MIFLTPHYRLRAYSNSDIPVRSRVISTINRNDYHGHSVLKSHDMYHTIHSDATTQNRIF